VGDLPHFRPKAAKSQGNAPQVALPRRRSFLR
jgi:hypothetical protein